MSAVTIFPSTHQSQAQAQRQIPRLHVVDGLGLQSAGLNDVEELEMAIARHPSMRARNAHGSHIRAAEAAPTKESRTEMRSALAPVFAASQTTASSAQVGSAQVRSVSLPENYRIVVQKAFAYLCAVFVVIALGAGLGTLLRPAQWSGASLEHSVSAGDSLWTLAASLQAPKPVEDVIWDIRSLNDLSGSKLIAGQTLLLPQY